MIQSEMLTYSNENVVELGKHLQKLLNDGYKVVSHSMAFHPTGMLWYSVLLIKPASPEIDATSNYRAMFTGYYNEMPDDKE